MNSVCIGSESLYQIYHSLTTNTCHHRDTIGPTTFTSLWNSIPDNQHQLNNGSHPVLYFCWKCRLFVFFLYFYFLFCLSDYWIIMANLYFCGVLYMRLSHALQPSEDIFVVYSIVLLLFTIAPTVYCSYNNAPYLMNSSFPSYGSVGHCA